MVRLGCHLRYCAGGLLYDIATMFGIGVSKVFESVWEVTEELNDTPKLGIHFPSCFHKQEKMAREFKTKSLAKIDCCVGAVDGLLVWINQPTKKCCELANCDPGKFYCGRKHKFGLNCQAICDANGQFLDILIMYPGLQFFT